MKTVRYAALALVLSGFCCSAAWAKLCPSCHADLPDRANFCLTCGLQQPSVAVPEPPPAHLPGQSSPARPSVPEPPPAVQADPLEEPAPDAAPIATPRPTPPKPRSASSRGNKETLFKVFTPVDTFEKAIKSGTYTNIVGGFPEFKSTYAVGLRKFEQARPHLPEALRILGQMYIEKAKACEAVVAALNGMPLDSSYRDALLLYYGQVLSWYNRTLQKARNTPDFTDDDTAALRKQADYIALRCARHEIKAKYLRVGGTDVPRGGSFAVLEVKNRKAMVLILCETPSDTPLQGWLSLPSLEGRTTWTAKNEYAFSKNPFAE